MSRTRTALVVVVALPACTVLFPFGASERDAGPSTRDAAQERDAGPGNDAGTVVDGGRDADAGPDAACGDPPTVVDEEGSSASAVAVRGTHAYVGRWSSGIRIFDIDDPRDLRSCREFDIAGDGNVVSVRRDDDDLLLAKEQDGIVRLTFGASPCDPAPVTISAVYALDVIPCGEFLCAATDSADEDDDGDGIDVLERDGSPVDRVDVLDAHRLAVAGDYLLVATDWSGEIAAIEFRRMEMSTTRSAERVADLAVIEDAYVLVAAGEEGLILYDIGNLPSLDFTSIAPTDEPAVAVATNGAWAFVGTGDDPDGWVEIFDITDPLSPTWFDAIELPQDVQGIDLTATHVFVAADEPLVAVDRGCAR